ncbi:hypothetical protein [Streptomyces sp. ISL-86]|uniref:hypothetical protein n=1 Tax=Streptomyces sp. ISL-86 TaxID=2819187 RepID=UPI001BE9AB50|nr:hypothetical protein [Streptomyces sp. ISL-86]MBT2453372.1 hypothetical protein [Streptomyces sp. ISL-86]
MDAPVRGAWLRAGISRDGGPLVETGHVVWLQSGTLYADSRGFAGRTSYDGDQVTFHHDVGTPGHDVGTLRSEGTRMIETGTNLDGSTFMEVWTPLSAGDGPDGSWSVAGTQTVRVGSHVVHVDAAGGAHFDLTGTMMADVDAAALNEDAYSAAVRGHLFASITGLGVDGY